MKMKKLMNSCVLFSGGKDSSLALYEALRKTKVKCLITLNSENRESYMYHTINISLTKSQAKAIGLPIIIQHTKGIKEEELNDLERVLNKAKREYQVEVVVSGAIASNYQKKRIEEVCKKLKLKCWNPLWKKEPSKLLKKIVNQGFKVVIVGSFALGLERFAGKIIDERFIKEIQEINKKYQVSIVGEGGEFETFTLDAPYFKKEILILESEIVKDNENCEMLIIRKIKLKEKQKNF